MDAHTSDTSREDFWRLQEALNELSTTQAQHADRIMRLEKRTEDGTRGKGVWGPSSPFPSALGSSNHGQNPVSSLRSSLTNSIESALNPAAEAFRNFDAEPSNAMISSLTLDSTDDPRRIAASRANSVRFDESANNHYGPSRASMDLPLRTGSGLGSHPLSERSLSHRSERGSTSGFSRANSFGLESSRLLGSIHNSPRVSGNPPPGFFMLGPCPSIVRCWLTETFTNNALLYAAICTGSSVSSIDYGLVSDLGMLDSIIEENGLRKVKLLVYLAEAKIQVPSSRSASPAPQVPSITAKFLIQDNTSNGTKGIQVVLGSDVLREHSADILFSQDKVMLYDDDRNQLSVPLVRPENDAVYKDLMTGPRDRRSLNITNTLLSDTASEQSTPGIIGRPRRAISQQSVSPIFSPHTNHLGEAEVHQLDEGEPTPTVVEDLVQPRPGDDSKSTTGSEKSTTVPPLKVNSGVWSNSWRSTAGAVTPTDTPNGSRSTSMGSYSRPNVSRPMKILRPLAAKGSAAPLRMPSSNTSALNGQDNIGEGGSSSYGAVSQKAGADLAEMKPSALNSKANPAGSASAFPWLSQGAVRKPAATK